MARKFVDVKSTCVIQLVCTVQPRIADQYQWSSNCQSTFKSTILVTLKFGNHWKMYRKNQGIFSHVFSRTYSLLQNEALSSRKSRGTQFPYELFLLSFHQANRSKSWPWTLNNWAAMQSRLSFKSHDLYVTATCHPLARRPQCPFSNCFDMFQIVSPPGYWILRPQLRSWDALHFGYPLCGSYDGDVTMASTASMDPNGTTGSGSFYHRKLRKSFAFPSRLTCRGSYSIRMRLRSSKHMAL